MVIAATLNVSVRQRVIFIHGFECIFGIVVHRLHQRAPCALGWCPTTSSASANSVIPSTSACATSMRSNRFALLSTRHG